MGQKEILELEKLVNQSELVAPLTYSNPKRDEKVFYNFIESYADQIGFKITEKKTGFIDSVLINLAIIRNCFFKPNVHFGHRIIYGIVTGLSLLISPISYPIFGAVEETEIGENYMVFHLPKYNGVIKLGSGKPHEYLHAYHKVVSIDLKKRKLLPNINGYFDIGLMEPQLKVPTSKELKYLERKFLKAMIKEEKKYL